MTPDCAITVQSAGVCARQETCCRIPDAVPPHSVAVPASVAADVLRLLVLGLDALVRKDGGRVAPRAHALLLELHRAAQAYEEGPPVPSPELTEPATATVEVSVADAAGVIGASREYTRRLCRAGVLPARRIGREWLVTIERQHLDQGE